MDIALMEQKLKAPFAAKDIEFRISRVTKNTRKAFVLAYITSRAVMDRLDEVFGLDGWQDEYEVLKEGVVCKLSVRFDSVWVVKVDSAPYTNIESLKGGFSDALKRAAVKLGIGRYLYSLPEYIVDILENKPTNVDKTKVHVYYSNDLTGAWIEPDLPAWALPGEESTRKLPVPQSASVSLWERKKINNSDYLRIELRDLLESLSMQSAITPVKQNEYLKKINDETVGYELLNYFYEQLLLIDKLYSLVRESKVSNEERKEFYKEILSSKKSGLKVIENRLEEILDNAA